MSSMVLVSGLLQERTTEHVFGFRALSDIYESIKELQYYKSSVFKEPSASKIVENWASNKCWKGQVWDERPLGVIVFIYTIIYVEHINASNFPEHSWYMKSCLFKKTNVLQGGLCYWKINPEKLKKKVFSYFPLQSTIRPAVVFPVQPSFLCYSRQPITDSSRKLSSCCQYELTRKHVAWLPLQLG